jgi:hypothetical protein
LVMLASGFTLTAFIVTVVSVHLRQIPAAP